MKTFFGFFLVLGDLLKSIKIPNLDRKIKHFFFVQSWWRILIIILISGIIGFGYNIFGSIIAMTVTIVYLLGKQEKYARSRGDWNSMNENEHFIVPGIISILVMGILLVASNKTSVPKYEIIKEITLNEKTVTEKAYVYLNINGMVEKLETGSSCTWGETVKIYKETKDAFWINPNVFGSYYLDCNRPMKKFTEI